jgi:hypothetical protein
MKEQWEKTEHRLKLEPKNPNNPNVQMIMAHELAGKTNGEIAEAVGLTASRVSIIRNSPLYKRTLGDKREHFHDRVIEKKSDEVVGVNKIFQEVEEEAALTKVDLLRNAKNESVKNLVATEILAYRGYQPKAQAKTTSVVEITEKMADRFERVLGRGTIKMRAEVQE